MSPLNELGILKIMMGQKVKPLSLKSFCFFFNQVFHSFPPCFILPTCCPSRDWLKVKYAGSHLRKVQSNYASISQEKEMCSAPFCTEQAPLAEDHKHTVFMQGGMPSLFSVPGGKFNLFSEY